MNRIFVSYRRQDSSGYAGRLRDRLRGHFGDDQVFMDIDGVEPGLDYGQFVEDTIDTIDVMVAVLGRQWLTVLGPTGERRLDEPDDLVSREIAGALERKIRVIPVLVDGATMPTAHDLPPALIPLAHRNAIDLTDSRWDYDCLRLVGVLERALGEPAVRTPAESLPTPPAGPGGHAALDGRPQRWALSVVLASAALAVAVWGVLAPRVWHSEWAGLRITFEAVLVVLVIVALWLKQSKWSVGAGIVGVVGLVAWAQILLSGGHTMNDLVASPDGPANILAFIASGVVLGCGLLGVRTERGSRQTLA